MILKGLLVCLLGGTAVGAWGASTFWEQASGLVSAGKFNDANQLTQQALRANPDDPDALVIAGTLALYKNLAPRRDDSIFRPTAEPGVPPVPGLTRAGAQAVGALWSRVPALDPDRGYLWGDLAQLTYRAGNPTQALSYAGSVLALPQPDPQALQSAATVFALDLDAERAAQAFRRIPGSHSDLLYQGLAAWRKGLDGWRKPLEAFVADPGIDPAGKNLAAYLIGPAMRDTEAGYQEALKVESGIPGLIVRQKYVDRYPTKFLARLALGRALNEYGNFPKALAQYAEIDRLGLASDQDQRQAVLFQQAWATQASGQADEAERLWKMLVESRDFYLRSAAAWFLGSKAQAQGNTDEAIGWWSQVSEEPARSKYAYWADAELKKLR